MGSSHTAPCTRMQRLSDVPLSQHMAPSNTAAFWAYGTPGCDTQVAGDMYGLRCMLTAASNASTLK